MKRPLLAALLFLFSVLANSVYAQTAFDTGLKDFKDENYEEALDQFIAARKANPDSSTAAFYLGLTYKVMENYREAVPHLKDAVRLTPSVKEALLELVDALYQTDDVKGAREYIAIGEKENIMPARLQFLKGLVTLKEGSYEEAIGAFEKAKALDASLSQSADFQIANAYMRLGKYKDAHRRFKSVTLVDPTSDIAAFARDYERILGEKLEKERPWRVSLGLNYKHDTNVIAKGSGPIADQISGEAGSAMNMNFRLGYTAPFTFSTPFSLSIQYSLFAERYLSKKYVRADGTDGNLTEYNTMTNVIGLLPGYNFKRLSLSVPVSFAYSGLQGQKGNDFAGDINWYNDARYMNYVSVNPTATFMVTGNHFAELSAGFLKKKYYDTELHPAPLDPAEDRDGKTWSGGLGWMYFFKEGKGLLRLRYSYSEEATDGDNWKNREHRFAGSLLTPIRGKLKGQIAGEAAFTEYTRVNPFFDMARRNETYNGSVSLIYEIFKNAEAVAQYTYVRDRSNIPIYDYRKEVVTIGIEYRY